MAKLIAPPATQPKKVAAHGNSPANSTRPISTRKSAPVASAEEAVNLARLPRSTPVQGRPASPSSARNVCNSRCAAVIRVEAASRTMASAAR